MGPFLHMETVNTQAPSLFPSTVPGVAPIGHPRSLPVWR